MSLRKLDTAGEYFGEIFSMHLSVFAGINHLTVHTVKCHVTATPGASGTILFPSLSCLETLLSDRRINLTSFFVVYVKVLK